MIGVALAALCGVPFMVLIAELAAGLGPSRGNDGLDGTAPSLTILIPAHDEAKGIAATVRAVLGAMPVGSEILVVADNCSDDTAVLARNAGARVLERHDDANRGKGFALAAGRDALRARPPRVVVILDADCTPHGDTLGRIALLADRSERPVQAINLVDPPVDRDAMGRVSTFAFRVKNLVRQRGLQRIAGTCVLTGTGMAIPWALFDRAPLATADSVEDLALGLAFVMQGHTPLLSERALVTSPSPGADAAVGQRTRWEHGFIATAGRVAPRLLSFGLRRGRWSAIWLGLHLMVPPLALLIMLGAVVLAGLALVAPAGAMLFGAIYVAALATILLTWGMDGRTVLPARLLLRIPAYILWKLPIYLKLVRGGADRRWTRTGRD